MCGIAGIWGTDDAELVRRMVDRLAHRGPDGRGYHHDETAGAVLGHARLAVMDPERGEQPMHGDRADAAIVGNSEIYNYPHLREDLQFHHRFASDSDTEAALHLYEDLGVTTAQRLDGMFALAIVAEEELYLARDPLGIKPLYLGRIDDALVFASEQKALLGIAEQIRPFPPGTWFHSSTGFRTYYTVPDHQPRDFALEPLLGMVRETVDEAVRKRLMSDVPVGAFLSGGLDSSIITALMRPHVDELHTFAAGVEGSSDLEAARRVAEHLGTEHHEAVFTVDDIERHLPEIVFHLESFDQHLVRSAIPCFFCARRAAEHVKVVLTGEGADELFAGYAYLAELDDAALHDELRRLVTRLHGLNLQRVDRLTMAHGLEARVPFLDPTVVQLALVVHPRHKMKRGRSRPVCEKWLLRRAFADLLPDEIVERPKRQFDEGSGTARVIEEVRGRMIDGRGARSYAAEHADDRLRSTEECLYHRLLVDAVADATPLLANVERWAPGSALPTPAAAP